MIRRTILEWESIRYGDAADEMPAHGADRIAAVASASPLSGRGGGGGGVAFQGGHPMPTGGGGGGVAFQGGHPMPTGGGGGGVSA